MLRLSRSARGCRRSHQARCTATRRDSGGGPEQPVRHRWSGGRALTAWIVGTNDRCKAAATLKPVVNWISEAEQYYAAMQIRGVPTALVKVPAPVTAASAPSQSATRAAAILAWFDKCRVKWGHSALGRCHEECVTQALRHSRERGNGDRIVDGDGTKHSASHHRPQAQPTVVPSFSLAGRVLSWM